MSRIGSDKPDEFTILELFRTNPDEQATLALWDLHGATLEVLTPTSATWIELSSICSLLRRAGKFSSSLRIAQSLYDFGLLTKNETIIAHAQGHLGRCYWELWETSQAIVAYREALVASQRSADYPRYCRILLWLSFIEQMQGHLTAAQAIAEEAESAAAVRGLQPDRAYALQHIAVYQSLKGDLRTAENSVLAATAMLVELDEELEVARTQLSHAYLSVLMERFGSANELIRKARGILTQRRSIRDLAISFEYEALLRFGEKNFSAAETAIREAVRISLEEFPDGDMTSQSYRIWAEIDIRKGDFEKAREHATDALGVARRLGERIEIGALERIFGQCDDEAEETQSAQAHFAESIKILSDCGARYELAHSYLAAGKADSFDRATRLVHLHSALALFGEMEVERLANEAEEAIRRLTSPPRPRAESVDTRITVITRNQAMKQVLTELDRYKDTPHVILLEGETGAGKDLLAAYTHFTSARAERPFVEFNAAAVPEALVESELFGHVRGSFTGAMRDREGLLFAAKNGTFFFNEIGEAPLTFQTKLLTVIESRKARPVGANVERVIEARLIFATNRDLKSEVSKGRFRKDLYFRLSTAHLKVPPLRDRSEDIGPLLEAFLQREGLSHAQITVLQNTSEWGSLATWPWEGNVRELCTFAQRLAVEVLADARQRPELVLPRLMKRTVGNDSESRQEFERCRIESALKRHGGNKRRAAGELGIPESTLRWKINHFGIELP